jgi:hypothetical protein
VDEQRGRGSGQTYDIRTPLWSNNSQRAGVVRTANSTNISVLLLAAYRDLESHGQTKLHPCIRRCVSCRETELELELEQSGPSSQASMWRVFRRAVPEDVGRLHREYLRP